MLPESLVSSYRKYKSDTDHIGNWLVSTAKKYGYPADLLTTSKTPTANPAPTSTRLKGKARKAAKAAGTASSVPPISTPPKKKYILAIKDFIPLAQHISSKAKGLIEKSSDFAATLDRAISLRRDHSSFHDENSKDDMAPAVNKSHQHFIGILEDVRETLRPRLRYGERADYGLNIGETEIPNKPVELTNMFARLNVEEPSEQFLNALPTQPTSSVAESAPSLEMDEYEVEQSDDLREVILARNAFMTDMNRFRDFIGHTWHLYKTGATTLEAAAISTNTALDLARGLHEEYQNYFPTSIVDLIHDFFAIQCAWRGEDPNYRELPDDPTNLRMYDVADISLVVVYSLLSSYAALLKPGSMPLYKPGFYGTYDASSDRSKKSGREKWEEDQIILLEVLSDFFVISHLPPLPAEDEITRSLRSFMTNKLITFPVLIATQTFLDIHHVLRDKISKGFHDLGQIRGYIDASITSNLKLHENRPLKTWPEQNDMAMKDLVERVNGYAKVDFVAVARRRWRDQFLREDFLVMKQHPLFCGTLSFSFKAEFRELGITFVNAWGSVLYTAHLYNAAKQEKLLHDKRWADMDYLQHMHGIGDFFIGAPPKDADAYFKHFSLSMGISASEFAGNRKKTKSYKTAVSKQGPRGLTEYEMVSDIFKDRFCVRGNGRFDIKPADIELVLKNCGEDYFEEITDEARAAGSQEVSEIPITNVPTPTAMDSKKLRKQWTAKQRWQHTKTLTPLQLLYSLRTALEDESMELVFDYFRLHRQCWLLLQVIKERLDPDLRQMFGPDYIERESQLPTVVAYIFMAAVKDDASIPGFSKKRRSDVVTNELLERAAASLEEFCESGTAEIVLKCIFGVFGYRWSVDGEVVGNTF
ncbi:hypothetical protein Vi05172_g11587 [Venturia inaequalis]|nr:hypothetical protein Vi05172_g11587 [Venturia inaequalis]